MIWEQHHREKEILGQLNRGSDEFPDIKNFVFYYDEKIKCWLMKHKQK